MSIIYDGYMLGGIAAAVAAVGTWRHTIRKVDKTIKPIAEAGPELKEVAASLTETLEKHKEQSLSFDVESYSAVAAANKALQEVINESRKQLADASVSVAESTKELAVARGQLATAQRENIELQRRVSTLEAQVDSLNKRLQYFTSPPKDM